MEIRSAEMKELDEIMAIYAGARQFMKESGNPNQWGPTNWPPRDLIIQDIENQKCHVMIEDGEIQCVFYFDYGYRIEDTYNDIDGEWLSDAPYGVVHRIASSFRKKGSGARCIDWAYQQCHNLRIDTHADNVVMQRVVKKLGFTYCGIIYVHEDKDPRYAYQKEERHV